MRLGCITDDRLHPGNIGEKLLPDDRLEQFLLVLEVEVQRPFADVGLTRDVFHHRLAVALSGEHRPRRIQDCPPPVCGGFLPLRGTPRLCGNDHPVSYYIASHGPIGPTFDESRSGILESN